MDIQGIYNKGIGKTAGLDSFKEVGNSISKEQGNSFGTALQTAMNQFDQSQSISETAIQSLVTDDGTQLHDIMIQTTEAQLSLELAIQVRNKCLDAYNEIKNMQF